MRCPVNSAGLPITAITFLFLGVALAASLSPVTVSHAAVNNQVGGICGRTEAVRIALIDRIADSHPSVAGCADVTDVHLSEIRGTLDLRSRDIQFLQEGDFDGLTQLTTLDLSRNQLRTLPKGVFAGLESLVHLDLWYNELLTLPEGIFAGLGALQYLDLEENNLHTLPSGVFAGLDLIFLGLEDNRLRTLPQGLFDQLDVTLTLDLSDNQLHSLPGDVFTGLSNVRTLDLSANRLKMLPPGLFSGLSGINELWLGKNPGAPFTFTMTPQPVPGTNSLVVAVPWGAPFPMETTLTVSGGTPTVEGLDVPVPTGRTVSDEIDMTSLEGARVTLAGTPKLPNSKGTGHYGFKAAISGTVTLFDTASGATTITSDPGVDETYMLGDAIDITVTLADNTTVDTADGTPHIGLWIGTTPKLAGYTSGSGTDSLVFRYVVEEGDLDEDGLGIGAGSIAGHRVDGVRPLMLKAAVHGADMTLHYSESLSESHTPSPGSFSVSGGKETRTVSSVDITGNTVSLTLNPPVQEGEPELTLSYTAPTTGSVPRLGRQ